MGFEGNSCAVASDPYLLQVYHRTKCISVQNLVPSKSINKAINTHFSNKKLNLKPNSSTSMSLQPNSFTTYGIYLV